MTIDQMREAHDDGAHIEFLYHSLLGAPRAGATSNATVQQMKAVGPEHCIMSSGLGQADNPLPVAGWKAYIEEMQKAGMTARESDTNQPRKFQPLSHIHRTQGLTASHRAEDRMPLGRRFDDNRFRQRERSYRWLTIGAS